MGDGQSRVWGLHRLYARIYLAVLVIVVLLMLAFAMAWHLHTDPRSTGQVLGGLASSVERDLSRDLTSHGQQAVLATWSARMSAELTLYAADGEVASSAGGAPKSGDASQGLASGDQKGGSYLLSLSDGRKLAIDPHPAEQMVPGAKGTTMVFFMIALIVGLGCYPVVRGLTRRLERLQHAVEAWDGNQRFQPVDARGRDEIAALATSFNKAADWISTLLQAQKSLLANASHEIRSPLARLRLAIELLPPPESPVLHSEMTRNIDELDELVEEILLASRLEALEGAALRPALIDVAGLLRTITDDVDVRVDNESLAMEGDPRLIGRVLRNLLDNAQRHGGGTPVAVRARAQDRGVRIEVCDRGPGIAAAERERVFEPFYRAAGASEQDGGVGLGLSLVTQIVQLHRGWVTCQPRAGGGSCFVVWLPQAHVPRAHDPPQVTITSDVAPPPASATATPP